MNNNGELHQQVLILALQYKTLKKRKAKKRSKIEQLFTFFASNKS